jgi:hypothetical protein
MPEPRHMNFPERKFALRSDYCAGEQSIPGRSVRAESYWDRQLLPAAIVTDWNHLLYQLVMFGRTNPMLILGSSYKQLLDTSGQNTTNGQPAAITIRII